MSALPLVSVVIPTFNRAALLSEALRSALAQTHRRLEALVVDDGSTDDTAATVRGLGDPRVSYTWQPNAGWPAPARNRALRAARGEFVAFLDDDDLWEPVLLERSLAAFAAHPDVLVVSHNGQWLPRGERPVYRMRRDLQPSFDELLLENYVLNSGAVIRRELLDAVGFLDTTPGMTEDYDYWLRALRYRDRCILVLREPLVHYRRHTTNISARGWAELKRIEAVFAKHSDREVVGRALATRRLRVRRAELLDRFRAGEMPVSEWLRQREVPLRRRLRIAARSLFGRSRPARPRDIAAPR